MADNQDVNPVQVNPINVTMANPQLKAHSLVYDIIQHRLEKTDPAPAFQIYTVWFAFVLGGWKCLISSTLPDGKYYEVTYNNLKQETYIDTYLKFDNVCVPD